MLNKKNNKYIVKNNNVMPVVKIYKIFNSVDETDKEFYIGCTKQKYLCKRWGHHRHVCRKGMNRKLYNHMREQGLENFKCIQIHTEDIDGEDIDKQRALEQKYVDEMKPTLNTNNVKGVNKKPINGDRTRRLFGELIGYNNEYENKLKEYAKKYHEQYSPDYYKKNKERIRANQREHYKINKQKLNEKQIEYFKTILESKKFYCEKCELPCRSIGALNKHNQSKAHLKK